MNSWFGAREDVTGKIHILVLLVIGFVVQSSSNIKTVYTSWFSEINYQSPFFPFTFKLAGMHGNPCYHLEIIEVYLQKLTPLVILCSILLLRHILSPHYLLYVFIMMFFRVFWCSPYLWTHTPFPVYNGVWLCVVGTMLIKKNCFLFWKFLYKTSVLISGFCYLTCNTTFCLITLQMCIFHLFIVHDAFIN